MIRWGGVYLLRGLPNIYSPAQSISVTPVSPYAPVAQSLSVIPVSPYTRRRSVLCQAEWRWCEKRILPPQRVGLFSFGGILYGIFVRCPTCAGFPIVRPVRAMVSPGPNDNFRGKQTMDCLGLGQQSHGRKDCRALQSSSAHCARQYYNTNMITYTQTRPSAHYQASSIYNCSSSASVGMWTLASSGTQPQHSGTPRIWSSYRP